MAAKDVIREMQTIYTENKVLCPVCYEECTKINAFTKFTGLRQHLSVKHKIKLGEEMKSNAVATTRRLHGEETMEYLVKFCNTRYVRINAYAICLNAC